MLINSPLMAQKQSCQRHNDCVATMAVVAEGTIAVQDRRHGTSHGATFDIHSLVKMLDPKGTSYRQVTDR